MVAVKDFRIGQLDGQFTAYDARTLQEVWSHNVGAGINAPPISYSVNGKQYVAVSVGNGSSHARSLATLTPEILNPDGGSALWVFALPDR